MPILQQKLAFLEKATETLRAVAHPIRLSIIELLRAEGPLNVKDIQEHLDIAQPVASHHLRILRDREVVSVERIGQNSRYALTDDRFAGVLNLVEEILDDKEE